MSLPSSQEELKERIKQGIKDGTIQAYSRGSCKYAAGIPCRCQMENLIDFDGLLPYGLAHKDLFDFTPPEKGVNFKMVGYCSCGLTHKYNVKFEGKTFRVLFNGDSDEGDFADFMKR